MSIRSAIFLSAGLLIGAAANAVATPLDGTVPLNEDACYGLRDQMEASFELSPAFLTTPKADVDLAAFGVTKACQVKFEATGVLFETNERRGFQAADDAMRAALDEAGWTESEATRTIAADGPYATLYARAKGDAVCVVEVSLTLPEEAMADAPHSLGDLMKVSIAERRYRLALSCVEQGG